MISQLKWMNGLTLESAELQRIAEIDNQIPAEFDSNWSPNLQALIERVEYYRKLSEDDFFQVVYDKDEIVGFHILRDAKNSIAHISTLWVHPSYRNRGIGKRLKELGIHWAQSKGFSFLQTGVHLANERMMDINKKLGFKPHSTVYRLKL